VRILTAEKGSAEGSVICSYIWKIEAMYICFIYWTKTNKKI
jgi:hypothetical protein